VTIRREVKTAPFTRIEDLVDVGAIISTSWGNPNKKGRRAVGPSLPRICAGRFPTHAGQHRSVAENGQAAAGGFHISALFNGPACRVYKAGDWYSRTFRHVRSMSAVAGQAIMSQPGEDPNSTHCWYHLAGICSYGGNRSRRPLPWEVTMFEVDQFVADCRAVFAEDPTHKAVREVLARAVSDPGAVLKGLGEPKRAEIRTLFHSPSLTIINVVWAPMMTVMPHNHRMWAVIGIYSGREDNIFWRRVREVPNNIEAVGAKALREGDAELLGADIIHSVLNPIDRLTGAIHIYGGDFFGAERSEWDSLTLLEHRSDGERTRRMFEEANARFEASKRIREN